ncbi:uncharacterized protein ACN2A1_014766 isoform 2-T7 [Glossina fuscipes fuscipes]
MQQNLACRLAHGNKAEGRENTKLSKPRIQTLIYLTIICTCNCGNHPGSQPRQPTLTSLVFQLSDNTIRVYGSVYLRHVRQVDSLPLRNDANLNASTAYSLERIVTQMKYALTLATAFIHFYR